MKFFAAKGEKLIAVVALIHWIITFFTDHIVFDALSGNGIFRDIMDLPTDGRFHFVLCKLILLVVIYALWRAIYITVVKGLLLRLPEAEHSVAILMYAALYFIPIIAVLIFKLPQGFLSNDESLIFAEASLLHSYTWFYYLTTYYYIVTMMLIPSWLGPILVKVFIQVFVCGYCVYRFHNYRKTKWSYLIYIPFFLPPVLAYTTSAHRIPVYYLIYLLMIFMLVMDRLEGVIPSRRKVFWLMVCGGLITQWRTEGIYMLGLIIILLLLTYSYLLKDKRTIFIVIIVSLMIQYAMTIPQNGLFAARLGDQADNRMGPFWAYTVTNMYRNGLDLEKNKADMEKIWRYLDKGTLQAINDDLGDINYEDVLILYYEGYTGKIESATPEDYNAYVEGCKSLFIHNPLVFLKTRIGAFKYAAMPYNIAWTSGGIRGFASFVISIIKTCAYCLYIPCILVIAFWVYCFIKKRWQEFFIYSGLICHWFIVFILAPASYFKYYFPIYMLGYYFAVFYCLCLLEDK